jgi:hypothetical protein
MFFQPKGDRSMNDNKKTVNNSPPIHSIVCGNVKADIFACQTNNGFRFLQFSLGRCFVSQSSQKESHSNFFFAENQDEIIQAVQNATAWISQQTATAQLGEVPDRIRRQSPVAPASEYPTEA